MTTITRSWPTLASGRFATLAAFALAVCVAIPLLGLGLTAMDADPSNGLHLLEHVIPTAAINTLLLITGVALIAAVVGTGCAWLLASYTFPGHTVLSWALLLPLAMPSYIVAYAYLDLLHPLGPLQESLRALLGYSGPREFRLPDVRSLVSVIVLLGFVLYPYVYIGARTVFQMQSRNLADAARSLGESRWGVLRRVALPLARPAIVAGATLAVLEALNDVGASEMMGVQTLTTVIYSTWITRNDIGTAAQFAIGVLAIVLFACLLERQARARRGYSTPDGIRSANPERLSGARAWATVLLTALPVVIGFLLPAAYLSFQAGVRISSAAGISSDLVQAAGNSVAIALAVTACAVACSLVLAWAARTWRSGRSQRIMRLVFVAGNVGYAVPGSVLAIGMLATFAASDGALNAFRSFFFDAGPVLWLGGSLTGLVIACTMRMLAVSSGTIESGFARIPLSLDLAARSLGESSLATLVRVHLPLLRPALAAGALLVLVDAIKELPLTLMLRPMNVETLATWIYGEAARGSYEEASIAALAIVLVGLAPVMYLARTLARPPRRT